MRLAIVIQQEVSDLSEAKQKVQYIKDLLSDVPDLKITAQVDVKIEIPKDE
ncbi:hypothetical protein ES703_13510 [subsurface metagenome]